MNNLIDFQTNPNRGRRARTKVDEFQTKAWFNLISSILEIDAPQTLQKLIESNKVSFDGAKWNTTRAWDKYKTGKRTPSDGYDKDGKPSAVVSAEMKVPESGWIFRHLLWRAMRTKSVHFDDVKKELLTFSPAVYGCYLDLRYDDFKLESLLAQNLGRPIPIRDGDFHAALDHLAVNLMFLRLDIVRHSEIERSEIVRNISWAFKILAASPWINPFSLELLKWLENEFQFKLVKDVGTAEDL